MTPARVKDGTSISTMFVPSPRGDIRKSPSGKTVNFGLPATVFVSTIFECAA